MDGDASSSPLSELQNLRRLAIGKRDTHMELLLSLMDMDSYIDSVRSCLLANRKLRHNMTDKIGEGKTLEDAEQKVVDRGRAKLGSFAHAVSKGGELFMELIEELMPLSMDQLRQLWETPAGQRLPAVRAISNSQNHPLWTPD